MEAEVSVTRHPTGHRTPPGETDPLAEGSVSPREGLVSVVKVAELAIRLPAADFSIELMTPPGRRD